MMELYELLDRARAHPALFSMLLETMTDEEVEQYVFSSSPCVDGVADAQGLAIQGIASGRKESTEHDVDMVPAMRVAMEDQEDVGKALLAIREVVEKNIPEGTGNAFFSP